VENALSDEKSNLLMKSKKYQKCPGCEKIVEKRDGCNHITCICGYQFCYKCGNKYPCKVKYCNQSSGDEDSESNSEENSEDSRSNS